MLPTYSHLAPSMFGTLRILFQKIWYEKYQQKSRLHKTLMFILLLPEIPETI
jgi:hypothetical protein